MSAVTCGLCGAPATAALVAADRNRRLSEERFTYYRCTSCRTLQLVPVPADLGRYYTAEYYAVPDDRSALVAASGGERYKLELIRPLVAAGRLVEVGPAVGGFAAVMHDAGYDTSAVEMDADCCRFLRDVVRIPVRETDDPAAALAEGGPYDVIAMWHVIEHLPNPREVMTAAAAALAPGGVIALAAPNPEAFQFRVFGRRWTHLDAPRHLFLVRWRVREGRPRAGPRGGAGDDTRRGHAALERLRLARDALRIQPWSLRPRRAAGDRGGADARRGPDRGPGTSGRDLHPDPASPGRRGQRTGGGQLVVTGAAGSAGPR